jgi:hypothetical protein
LKIKTILLTLLAVFAIAFMGWLAIVMGSPTGLAVAAYSTPVSSVGITLLEGGLAVLVVGGIYSAIEFSHPDDQSRHDKMVGTASYFIRQLRPKDPEQVSAALQKAGITEYAVSEAMKQRKHSF